MSYMAVVGFAAGTLCTLAYLPQALHSFRTKSVRDISRTMLIGLNVGLLLWVAYGLLIHSLPIILPNAVTFFLAFPLLIMKLRFGAVGINDSINKNRGVVEAAASAGTVWQRSRQLA